MGCSIPARITPAAGIPLDCAMILHPEAVRFLDDVARLVWSGQLSIQDADDRLRDFMRLNPGQALLIKNIGSSKLDA